MPLYAFTGASGAGKSSVIEALALAGFGTQPEIGRLLVREQKAVKGDALPWADRKAFRDLLFARSIAAFDAVPEYSQTSVFFDRSFVEALAYSTIIGCAPSREQCEQAAERRFDDPVFVFPPWRAIYRTDSERKHGFEKADEDYEANIAAYLSFGYRLVEVPRVAVADRVRFVIGTVGQLD